MPDTNIEKLKKARKQVLEVYESEADDNTPDNGNLTILNSIVLGLNQSIFKLEK